MLEKLVVLIVFRLLRIKGRNLFIKCVPPSGVKNMNKDEYRPPLSLCSNFSLCFGFVIGYIADNTFLTILLYSLTVPLIV